MIESVLQKIVGASCALEWFFVELFLFLFQFIFTDGTNHNQSEIHYFWKTIDLNMISRPTSPEQASDRCY